MSRTASRPFPGSQSISYRNSTTNILQTCGGTIFSTSCCGIAMTRLMMKMKGGAAWSGLQVSTNVAYARHESKSKSIAPSWSWASRTYSVVFLCNSRPEVFYGYVCTAKVHAAAVALKGTNPTGVISEAYICMSGLMCETEPGTSMWTGLFGWYAEGYVEG
jgi:hypothetical protein